MKRGRLLLFNIRVGLELLHSCPIPLLAWREISKQMGNKETGFVFVS